MVYGNLCLHLKLVVPTVCNWFYGYSCRFLLVQRWWELLRARQLEEIWASWKGVCIWWGQIPVYCGPAASEQLTPHCRSWGVHHVIVSNSLVVFIFHFNVLFCMIFSYLPSTLFEFPISFLWCENASPCESGKRGKRFPRSTSFNVAISHAAQTPLSSISCGLRRNDPKDVREALSMLGVILRQQAVNRYIRYFERLIIIEMVLHLILCNHGSWMQRVPFSPTIILLWWFKVFHWHWW